MGEFMRNNSLKIFGDPLKLIPDYTVGSRDVSGKYQKYSRLPDTDHDILSCLLFCTYF